MNIIGGNALWRVVRANAANRLGAALVGVDVGARWVGLAVTDRQCRIVAPLATLERVPGRFVSVSQNLRAIVDAHRACGIVFGWPLELDGSEGRACARVRGFVGSLQCQGGLSDVPTALWDERYSSQGARDSLGLGVASRSMRVPRRRTARADRHHVRLRDKTDVDKVAAALILGSFIEAHSD